MCNHAIRFTLDVQPFLRGERPQLSRAASVKIAIRGTPNRLNCCLIFMNIRKSQSWPQAAQNDQAARGLEPLMYTRQTSRLTTTYESPLYQMRLIDTVNISEHIH
jgi:hypothetical protein